MSGFEQKVYGELRKIPRGKVATYKIVAQKIGSKAYRAVGSACRKNPNAPSVPCHRVVRSDASVGNYSRGVNMKIELLRKEGIQIERNKIKNFKKFLFTF